MPKKNIARACEAIGDSTGEDWEISPTHHPRDIESQAPELVPILKRSAASAAASGYKDGDRDAVERQRRFKSTSASANRTILVATMMGSAAGFFPSADASQWHRWLVVGLAVLGAIASGVAAGMLLWLRTGKLLEEWMSSRADAEALRLKYFTEITDAPPDAYTGLLQLEYFRRYQLAVQRAFFAGRARQHERAARTTQILGVIGVSVAMAANMLVGGKAFAVAGATTVTAAGVDPIMSGFSVLAVFGAALGAFVVAREGVSQDSHNAKRYDRMAKVLRAFEARLDDVRARVADGKFEVLTELVRSVHEELAGEQRAWLDQASRQESALGALDAHLQKGKPTEKSAA